MSRKLAVKPNGSSPVIEDGVPIPPSRNRNGFAQVLKQLKVGQSVLLPGTVNQVTSACVYALGQHNYTTRKEANGRRVWRLA